MSRIALVLASFYLISCGEDSQPNSADTTQAKTIVQEIPLPTSIEGRWKFQFNKEGATYQVWKIRNNSVEELGVCKRGWSAITDSVTSNSEYSTSSLSILDGHEDNPDFQCHASIAANVWAYRIEGYQLILTKAEDPSVSFIGTYKGPITD